ncbi:MAG: SMC-Scp complex subunit ScpB [Deltaproteobacteria bacterium]|nr:SMC-Scp complex subunit ScpB [Deltaproteobacteria bacterium]
MKNDLRRIVEALLFVAEGPLSLAQLGQVLETSDRAAIKQAVESLQQEYGSLERAFSLVEVAGGYSFRTRPELAFWITKLRKQQVTRLSRAALETLAIVAYRQPVLKAEIERIRGVEVGSVLKMLLEKGLVRVAGRRDLPGRPLVYATSRRFLEVFDLKDLRDLPTIEEIASLGEDLPEGLEAGQPELDFLGAYQTEAEEAPEPAGEAWPADAPPPDSPPPDQDPGPSAA